MLTGENLSSLVDGLESNDLLENYSHILTGYIGSATFLNAVSVLFLRTLLTLHLKIVLTFRRLPSQETFRLNQLMAVVIDLMALLLPKLPLLMLAT